MKRNVLHSPRLDELKNQKRRILRNKIIIVVFLFLALLTGLTFLSRWKKINIDNVVITGNKIVDSTDIENIVRADISGHYLWLFPKTNFLLYPKKRINRDLNNVYKRLSTISINVKNLKMLEINVSEYEGKYTWCGDVLPSENNTNDKKCYFMDSNGYVFDEAPYFSGNVYFRFFGKINRPVDANPIGNNFVSDKFVNLVKFKETLEQMNLKPSAFYLTGDGDINVFFTSEEMLPAGPVLRLKADDDYNKVAENLQAALSTEPLQTDFKKKYSLLQYIDLRFGNKVYYKFLPASGGQ